MHPADAAARGIADGDIVRLFNDRGACLAGVRVTDDIRRGVVQLADRRLVRPGARRREHPLCVHGNPNVLTRDVGTSRLAQGCTGQLTVVEWRNIWDRFLPSVPLILPIRIEASAEVTTRRLGRDGRDDDLLRARSPGREPITGTGAPPSCRRDTIPIREASNAARERPHLDTTE